MPNKDVMTEERFLSTLQSLNIQSKNLVLEQAYLPLESLEALVAIYGSEQHSVQDREAAGNAMIFLLRHYKARYQASESAADIVIQDDVAQTPSLWQRLKQKSWAKFGTRGLFGFMVLCGIINATAEAFDGVSAILLALHLPAPAILTACIVLGLFSILLYFAFELTRLSEAMNVPFIERYSEANRLHEIQECLQAHKRHHKQQIQNQLHSKNLITLQAEQQHLRSLFRALMPMQGMVTQLKQERPSTYRSGFKYFIAAMAGFLSGAIAFFNGEALLAVIASLTGITLGGAWLWLPIALGAACFVVVTAVSLVNEGKSMMRLIDKLWGKPSKVIDTQLDPHKWALSEQCTASFNAFVCQLSHPSDESTQDDSQIAPASDALQVQSDALRASADCSA